MSASVTCMNSLLYAAPMEPSHTLGATSTGTLSCRTCFTSSIAFMSFMSFSALSRPRSSPMLRTCVFVRGLVFNVQDFLGTSSRAAGGRLRSASAPSTFAATSSDSAAAEEMGGGGGCAGGCSAAAAGEGRDIMRR